MELAKRQQYYGNATLLYENVLQPIIWDNKKFCIE